MPRSNANGSITDALETAGAIRAHLEAIRGNTEVRKVDHAFIRKTALSVNGQATFDPVPLGALWEITSIAVTYSAPAIAAFTVYINAVMPSEFVTYFDAPWSSSVGAVAGYGGVIPAKSGDQLIVTSPMPNGFVACALIRQYLPEPQYPRSLPQDGKEGTFEVQDTHGVGTHTEPGRHRDNAVVNE